MSQCDRGLLKPIGRHSNLFFRQWKMSGGFRVEVISLCCGMMHFKVWTERRRVLRQKQKLGAWRWGLNLGWWKSHSHVQLFATPWTSPWNSPGQNTGVHSLSLLPAQGSSQPRDRTQVSRIANRFFTSWATRKAREYWSGYPIPPPGDLPYPEIEPGSSALQADFLPPELSGKP